MCEKTLEVNCVFGARYLLAQVHKLQAEITGALIGEDIEHIHQMRVASRRMRNGLVLFKGCFQNQVYATYRREIRNITRALGTARDLDIQIELINHCLAQGLESPLRPGYQRLLLRLNQQRTKAQEKVSHALGQLQINGLLGRMESHLTAMVGTTEEAQVVTPSLYGQACEAISSAMQTFLGYKEAISDPDRKEELHAMRIAGKHLRYTMEVFAPVYGDELLVYIQVMKEVQDLLGEIHDCDVWIAWLPEFIEIEQARIEDYFGHLGPVKRLLPGLDHFGNDRKRAREAYFQIFQTTWHALLENQTWFRLVELITSPVSDSKETAGLDVVTAD